MKTFMTTSLMTALLAGTALMAQTGKAPAPAAGVASTATPAPAKVKKHHRKAKKTAPDAATANAAPVKK